MTAIHSKAMRGMVPRTSDRLIDGDYAVLALNCKITAGRLDPLKGLGLTHTSNLPVGTMYRYRHNGIDNWLTWPGVVDVVRAPIANDTQGRFFYTGDGEPRMSTYADAIAGPGPYPLAYFPLGVYAPNSAPSLVITGGSSPSETRSYAYTFKNKYAEESGPSGSVVLSGFINGSWDLSGMEVAPPNSGTITAAVHTFGTVEITMDTVRGLTAGESLTISAVTGMTDLHGSRKLLTVNTLTNKVTVALTTVQTYGGGGAWARVVPHNTVGMTKIIYRTVGINTDYKRVAEIPATQTTYSDTALATALSESITTLNNFPAPKDLHSICVLANGSLAGLSGNQICFSEQYKPYSWPIANQYAFTGIGVAAFATGNSVVILTDSYPIVATATIPEAVSLAKIGGGDGTLSPCVAKRGAVEIDGGCLYPSHNGLYLATPSEVRNMTAGLFTYDEWKFVHPESFKAAYFDQRYYAQHDRDTGLDSRIMMLSASAPDSTIEIEEQVDSMYANPYDGRMYVSQGNRVSLWDEDAGNHYVGKYQSREYQLGAPTNFTFAQVHFEAVAPIPVDNSIIEANNVLLSSAFGPHGEINGNQFNQFAINGSGVQKVPGMFGFGQVSVLDQAAIARNDALIAANEAGGSINGANIGQFAINGSAIQRVAASYENVLPPLTRENSVRFELLVDRKVKLSRDLINSNPFRLPSGYTSEIQAWRVEFTIPIHSVSIAESARELAQVSV